jgi:mono/diheme cytochrome c family protein
MKRTDWAVTVLLVLSMLIIGACSSGTKETSQTGGDTPVPAPYAGMKNPFEGNAQAVTAGQQTYNTYCVSCHGTDLKGNGPAAAGLNPKPADLTEVADNDPEDRIHWIISEGGAAAGLSNQMVAFKGTLTDEQIWQLVTFIKSKK